MRRTRRWLTYALVLSLPASLGVPATALAHPQEVAQVAAPQVARAAAGPLAAPLPARVKNASTVATVDGTPARVRELEERRTASSTSYRMSDGTTQVELSTEPVHYKDTKGKWQDIDTKVTAGSGEDSFENAKNAFRTRFGKSSDRLLTFEADGESIGLGAAGEKRALTPVVKDSSVAFPDVFGTADVRYYVSRTGVKETVVLTADADVAGEYAFELHTSGLTAKAQPDGSIGFFKKNGDERPKYVIPAPNMYDSSATNQLGQPGYSDKITQTVTQQGGKTLLTLKPDQAWLAAKERVFPIVIDPTIVVVPDPTAAQDTSISEANAGVNYGTNPTVLVGDDASHNTWRGLLKFDTSMIPTTTTIRSADLNMHYGAGFGADVTLPFAAVKVTSAWSESTATWTSMNTAFNGTYASNTVQVDDQDTLSATYEGPWKYQSNASAVNGSFSYALTGSAPDTFTWSARVPSEGDYQVQGHYYPNSVRGILPTTLVGATSAGVPTTQTVQWNQTAGTPGPGGDLWYTLGTIHSRPGNTTQVKATRQQSPVALTIPIADAMKWTKYSTATKQAGDRDGWHSYGLGSYVQSWVSNPAQNFGVMLKAVDEAPATAPAGGLYYSASEGTYGGETAARPNLVVTYDEPGVTLNPPSTINASGAELTWNKYIDPTPADDDDLVEYQIFRGCRDLPLDGCTTPVGDYFSTTSPSAVELVGTVAPEVTSFTDATAKPSTATEAATYSYWVVARTVGDGTSNGKAASNVQTVTMPREGRVLQSFGGDISDTTLSKTKATENVSRPDGGTGNTRYWVQVGNNHPTYGVERGVFKFDTSAVKQGTKVTDARVELFSNYGSGAGSATLDLHGLTRDFVETEATWNQAASTINWTGPGGDYDPAVLTSLTSDNNPKRLTFTSTAQGSVLLPKIQSWVDNPGNNHGLLLKTHDETVQQQLFSITNGESPDSLFRPRLWIEHLAKNEAETYQADQIPERFQPNTTITTPVTLTNTSKDPWDGDLLVSYRWTDPGSTVDLTTEGERLSVPLGRALAPGESQTVDLPVRAPINSDTGTKRQSYDLHLDLRKPDKTWYDGDNATSPPARPAQGCVMETAGLLCVDRYVESATSGGLGLEKFMSYTGEETGGGSQLLTNLYNGNVVWSYDALSNPSIGPSAFVRLAYNSQDDTAASAPGYGFSVQPATLTRLGSGLSVAPNVVSFVDGDGTTQIYKADTPDPQKPNEVPYTRPAGVALELKEDLAADTAHRWVFTRPDGTRFYFDSGTKRQTSVVDRNGNTMSFSYDTDGRLSIVTDARNRQVLTLGYESGGAGKLVWIRDISGRALKFNYNTSSQLIKLEDGGPFNNGAFDPGAVVKSFQFAYTDTSNNSNTKLISVKDPRNAETKVQYYTSNEDSTYAKWPKSYTDRRNNNTTFSYAQPDPSALDRLTTVTDVNGSTPSVTTYKMDAFGRTTSIVDANQNAIGGTKATSLAWDRDHNVIRLQEPNDAVSTWEYDPKTGYPLVVKDAMAVKNGLPGVVLTYQELTTGAKPTVLLSKKSAAGRTNTFTYDANGNIKTVKNGLGFGPTYSYNSNGTLATVTDARGNATQYGDDSKYHASGYPLSITDPELAKTEFTYDDRGNVLQVKDALLRLTTAEYDAFGRPTKITKPYDGAVVRTTATDYDLNDNVTKETAPNGAQSVSTFDAADNLLTKTLPDNNTTGRQLAYTYDVLGRKVTETAPKGVATTTDPNDFVTKYSYDRVGQVLKVETPFVDGGTTKTPTTTYEYDLVGNQVTVMDPLRNASPATDYTSKTVYDLNHRPTAVTDAAGYTSKTVYDADGLVTSEINQTGNTKTTKYDDAGQPIEIHVPHTPIGGHQEDRVTKLAYDQAGNVTRQTRPSGRYSETVYDKNNRPVQNKSAFDTSTTLYKTPSSTFITYYPTGEIKAQSDPTFESSGTQWTNFTYFGSGDIKTSTDPWQITATYGYNQLGQQTDRTLTVPGDDAKRTQAWGYYPDGALQSRSDTAAQQPVDIVDNADTWQTTSTGTWATVPGGTNTQGANYRTHLAAAVGTPEASDTFNWRVLPDVAGSFDVYASCPVRADGSTAATYTINHSTGAATKTIDQKACTAATPWVNLGNYSFPNGVAKTITLKPSATGVVSADAIKLVSTSPVESRSFTHNYDLNGQQTEVKDNNPNAASDTFKITTDGLGRTTQVQELKAGATKATTDYTYDLDSNVLSTNAQRPADSGAGTPKVGRYTGYTWDVRNLVDTVKAGDSPTGTLDTWSYTYDGRGLRSTITKPNGNVATFTYHEDGLPRIQTEKHAQQLISSHALRYTPDGDRSQDVEKLLKANSSDYLDQASNYTYTPARQLEAVTKTGVEKGDNESYEYDAAGNTTKQTIGATTSTMTYDRNRLTKTVTGGTTLNQRYDLFGRSTTADVGSQVVEQNAYDGYDRLVRQQKFDTAGTATFTRNQTYDPFDRVVNQSEKVGAAASISTRYTFVGLADQVAIEEEKDTAGTWKTSKSYAYGANGENLSLVDSPVNGTTSKKSFYGTNPHGDVETLTDASTGVTTSTYRYTAYGQPDKVGTTGDDAIVDGDPAKNADIVNPYRFNSKRFNGATNTYDMGFREYNPGLNRFLSRDMYNGALSDMALGTDPWNANRYMFAGGNPITGVEGDGHCAFDPETESACGRPVERTLNSGSSPPPEPEARPHPDRFFEMAGCNGGPGCVLPEGFKGKYGPYKPIPGEEFMPDIILGVVLLFVPGGEAAMVGRAGTVIKIGSRAARTARAEAGAAGAGSEAGAATRGALEGVRDYQVMDPLNAGRTITDIDRIQDGVLWEMKSASAAKDPSGWIAKHIDGKFSRYLEARQHMPGYENAPIGFDFSSPMDAGFRSQVEAAIDGLRSAHPGVTIVTRFAQ
ncbi:DNRLRE domain-containing protein [Kribbella sindirgiensis]|uniref:DNRLRE domain-containing protein n=1 Tax=Kribbella sindirgiensis TaxID=1124744 RepID=A0A4R0HY56_9ACTN|nr:DNRLRE domain-containing protein [Kribbella sindirgiensis]TCC16724.1 DNRLRE domain-containing protein [Kribbella sindirgiensis]